MIHYKKCLITIHEMLKDRGYTGIRTDQKTMRTVATKNEEKMNVYFASAKKKGVGVHEVRDILEEVNGEKLILIYETSITFYAKQALKEYAHVETFQAKRLYYNVTKHVLVPPHRILNESEKEEVLLAYSVQLEQCKKMLSTDPVAKYYGATVGQLIEIQRCGADRPRLEYRVVV